MATGGVQHVVIKVPPSFPPGPYRIAAACDGYNDITTFAEKAFTVLAGPPATPAWAYARPAMTTSKTVGPIVVTYPTPLNRGAAITKYSAICVSSNGGVTRGGVHLGATAAPITVANATLKRGYHCTVRATNAKGTSAASPISETITVGAPAEVGYLQLTKLQTGTIRVGFPNLTAAQTNGSPLIAPRYTATCKSPDGGITRAATGISTPIVVRSMTAGKNYWCTVFAHNARGNGVPRQSSWGIYV
jgi:titin